MRGSSGRQFVEPHDAVLRKITTDPDDKPPGIRIGHQKIPIGHTAGQWRNLNASLPAWQTVDQIDSG